MWLVAIAITDKTLCLSLFCLVCFNICSIFSGLSVMSFHALNTHHLFEWHHSLPKAALLWKLSRWLLHIRPHLPVALAKPMLTVGLFRSLILKSWTSTNTAKHSTVPSNLKWAHCNSVRVGFSLGMCNLKTFNFRYFWYVVPLLMAITSKIYSCGMSQKQLKLKMML